MNSLLAIPELQALGGTRGLIRIPDQLDVPVTDRVTRLIDTPEFRRLHRVSQLGLVSFVYPGATHTRFEHSLGVYRMCLLFLQRLAGSEPFRERVSSDQAVALLVAALLHDLGHYPYCHPIEDLKLPGLPEHESLAAEYFFAGPIGSLVEREFGIDPHLVLRLIERTKSDSVERLLCSILSGPIDVDKTDYLYRDSLHTGVPYGKNFDAPRLIGSLCLNSAQDQLAITSKGRTAAELLVFARYVMFSEVYWHHAVRSATAMLQRIVYVITQQDPEFVSKLVRSDELSVAELISHHCPAGPIRKTLDGLMGPTRRLYKRVAAYNSFETEEIYRQLARRPYPWLVDCSERLSEIIGSDCRLELGGHDVLIDAPPVDLEVQFDVEVHYQDTGKCASLGEVSPVVNTLARHQFDDLVKQVRIFAAPDIAKQIPRERVAGWLQTAIREMDG